MTIEQQVEREISRRRQAEAAALAKEQTAKEKTERAALTEQLTIKANAAKARLQAEAIDPTVQDFAELAGAPAQWSEGLIAWVETGRALGEKQTEIFNQYGKLAFALGQRFGKLRAGGEFDREKIADMARQCLDSEFARINVWPDGAAPAVMNPFGITVDRSQLYKFMLGRMWDGVRSA